MSESAYALSPPAIPIEKSPVGSRMTSPPLFISFACEVFPLLSPEIFRRAKLNEPLSPQEEKRLDSTLSILRSRLPTPPSYRLQPTHTKTSYYAEHGMGEEEGEERGERRGSLSKLIELAYLSVVTKAWLGQVTCFVASHSASDPLFMIRSDFGSSTSAHSSKIVKEVVREASAAEAEQATPAVSPLSMHDVVAKHGRLKHKDGKHLRHDLWHDLNSLAPQSAA